MMRICLLLLVLLAAGTGGGTEYESNELEHKNKEQYVIKKQSIDGGGNMSSGGSFVLRGTVGQPDAETQQRSGLFLSGGLWEASALPIFSDGFESGDPSNWSLAVP